jgi:hypothetical protein
VKGGELAGYFFVIVHVTKFFVRGRPAGLC